MLNNNIIRNILLMVVFLLGVIWSLASAQQDIAENNYPNGHLLVTAQWLKKHADDTDIVIVDVRDGEHFDGRLIPGAVHLPWSDLRYNNTAINEGSLFIGPADVQKILGDHGIGRTDTIIIYDSVAYDGGATASYLFLVLDYLGHDKKMILDGGIDSWIAADYKLVSRPKDLSPILYQAPMDEIRQRSLISGMEIYQRLGDPHYQIVDVRSPEEYLGKKGTRDLQGNGLKLGHIPTAVNVSYESTWTDSRTKMFKSYSQLREIYRGLDPDNTIIVYCNSGRRSSFSYFVLRLMGFKNVRSFESSWKHWGKPTNFYPVETTANSLPDSVITDTAAGTPASSKTVGNSSGHPTDASSRDSTGTAKQPQSGYVSCGG